MSNVALSQCRNKENVYCSSAVYYIYLLALSQYGFLRTRACAHSFNILYRKIIMQPILG